VAGLQNYLRELLVMVAPTINSYTRLVKGAWAPTAGSWGVENRTAAIRVIGGSPGSQRIECRVPGADSNPYLVSAAIIAAALKGIEEKREPNEPVVGSAYDVQDDLPQALQFASNLRNATEHFAASKMAREAFGDDFVDHFATTRLWECREYEREINSWQLGRYFEII
jgi:glutamine synthetase